MKLKVLIHAKLLKDADLSEIAGKHVAQTAESADRFSGIRPADLPLRLGNGFIPLVFLNIGAYLRGKF
jgi:hypothetical protein